MTQLITSPIARQAILSTISGLMKLGVMASASILAGNTFRAATNNFVAQSVQNYKKIKNIL